MGATGQVQPTSGAVKVQVKVAPTLANTVKISADSAFALARASNDAGQISSAELEMKEKALVYNIKMIKGAGASVTAPAPSGASSMSPTGANASSGATGQVQPTSGAIKVDVKVAPTLANTVKISADSAFALARASNDAGQISSAELEMKERALVYNIKMVKGAGASVVHVDAMTGEVVKDKKYGGLKASGENDSQLRKLNEAKKDSVEAKKP